MKIESEYVAATALKKLDPDQQALLLSDMDSNTIIKILNCLPEETASEILKKLYYLKSFNYSERKKLISKFELLMTNVECETEVPVNGEEFFLSVFNKMDKSTKRSIVEELEENDEEFADTIKNKIRNIEAIRYLSPDEIKKVLDGFDARTIAVAFKMADEEIVAGIHKAFENDPVRLDPISISLKKCGPVRLSDIEKADEEILNKMIELADNGDIVNPFPC